MTNVQASSAADASFRWRAADLQDPARYTRWWSDEELAAFEAIANSPAASAHQAADPGPAPVLAPVLQRALDAIRRELQSGLGFVLLRGLPFERWSVDQARMATWAIAHATGVPVTQTAQGARLVDVMDTSRQQASPRQFSTSQELRLHTDPASDLIGLACVNPAAEGGDSVLASSVSVHDALAKQRPDLLALLYEGFHWHRFNEGRKGDAAVCEQRVPVFARNESGGISCRYVRSPIAAGHKEIGQPLTDAQVEALDLFDRLASSPELRIHFRMGPGDIVLVNNMTVMHARTQFTDHPEGQAPRRIFRLWLQGHPGFRDVPPVLNYFNGGECGIPVTGSQAAYDVKSLYADRASGGVANLGLRQ
ncbi:TauD/TfdA family dioxygenase [Ramlibacter sp. G-1-2-2]|uniref:TauD/TfdA family dioxygenase n=1 Tax=Ramlibacter agri TaxID=2728837 RepID=A0A848H8E6_9BURK|nr:TauD/TfdA family dioxygenase [Ramlibacter agri]NML44813.1 TauD/TfdA family dioxygenase [Ramlibacter agri]